MALAKSRGIVVIEDCAQAHGAQINGRSVGTFGDISAWSFCQEKIMTTGGEGGMITTNNKALYEKMWSFKDHGKSLAKVRAPSKSNCFKWMHDSIGTNWRLTEMQAALGRYQLGKVDGWVTQRRANVSVLNSMLREVEGVRVAVPDESTYHASYKHYCFIEPQSLRSDWDCNRIVSEVNSRGVPCFSGSCPEIYREKAFTDLYGETPRLEVARELGETSMMMNVHPGISTQQSAHFATTLKEVMHLAVG